MGNWQASREYTMNLPMVKTRWLIGFEGKVIRLCSLSRMKKFNGLWGGWRPMSRGDTIPRQVVDFLAGADPWLIAHAIAKGGKVVTFERRVGSSSSNIKIPNVCDYFRIETISLYQMFTEANIVLEFRG